MVNVSWASSDGHFYVIVNEDMRRLNEFVRDMNNYYQQSRRSGIHSRSYHFAKEGNLGGCLAFYQRDMAQVKGKIDVISLLCLSALILMLFILEKSN